MDVHLSDLHGCEARLWDRTEAHREGEERLVAQEPGHIDGVRELPAQRPSRGNVVRNHLLHSRSLPYKPSLYVQPQASHPRDWDNPGRVRVQWKENGRLTNPAIPTSKPSPPPQPSRSGTDSSCSSVSEKKLFEMIAAYIQGAKPEQVPNMASLSLKDTDDVAAMPAAPQKARPPAKSTRRVKKAPHPQQPPTKRRRPALPRPPLPLPPLQERISMYSPLIPSGALLEGWKVGVPAAAAADEKGGGAAGAAGGVGGGGGGGAGKGKRKVIKIRM